MPPEVLSSANTAANPAIDIWAMGIILFFLLYGFLPFRGSTDREIVKSITTQKIAFPIGKRKISAEVKKLILGMLVKNPKGRMKIDEIQQSEWLKIPYIYFQISYK
jgi:serine/threonine protein kinase